MRWPCHHEYRWSDAFVRDVLFVFYADFFWRTLLVKPYLQTEISDYYSKNFWSRNRTVAIGIADPFDARFRVNLVESILSARVHCSYASSSAQTHEIDTLEHRRQGTQYGYGVFPRYFRSTDLEIRTSARLRVVLIHLSRIFVIYYKLWFYV